MGVAMGKGDAGMKGIAPWCCGNETKLVKGDVIYPTRKSLHDLNFYLCKLCGAYVGCHAPGKLKGGAGKRGIIPLGKPGDAETRRIRHDIHRVFDRLWEIGYFKSRSKAYEELAYALNIPKKDCHIGNFDKQMAEKALEIVKQMSVRFTGHE